MKTFFHSGDLGDIISSLPVIKALGGGALYLGPGPGTREPMTRERAEFIAPLLLAQPYIQRVEFEHPAIVDHDISTFRDGYVTTVPIGEIIKRHIAPFITVDFRSPWLEAGEPSEVSKGRPVFNRTARYHNPEIDPLWPHILKIHQDGIFVGTNEEYEEFIKIPNAKAAHYQVRDALEMAQVIAASSIFIGNQSFPNLVAEGLKHNSITEHCKRQPDAFWKRPNALRLHSRKDWPHPLGKPVLMLALQFWDGEFEQVKELAQLIVSNEPEFREDVEFCVAVRDDVPQEMAEKILAIVSTRFRSLVVRSKRSGRGWPNGCNDLWQSTMTQLANLKREEQVKADAVLTFEADCIPLRADWIDVLQNEWLKTRSEGKKAFGTVHDAGGTAGLHINGNMVLDILATKIHPLLQTSHGCWDCYHARWFLDNGRDSWAIIQRYGDTSTVTREQVEAIRKGDKIPALLHGMKKGDARQAVREMIADGTFARS